MENSSHSKQPEPWLLKKKKSCFYIYSPHNPFLNKQTWDFQTQRRLQQHDTPECLLYELPEERRW